MEDVIIDCGALVEKCETCGGHLDWEGDWYGCARCRFIKRAKEDWPPNWVQEQFPEVAVDYSEKEKP